MIGLTPAYEIQAAVGGQWTTNPDLWGPVLTSNDARWNNVRMVPGSTGYRLPTEAQWEFAAKGGNTADSPFTFSGSDNPLLVAWHSANSSPTGLSGDRRTREVGGIGSEWIGSL